MGGVVVRRWWEGGLKGVSAWVVEGLGLVQASFQWDAQPRTRTSGSGAGEVTACLQSDGPTARPQAPHVVETNVSSLRLRD